MRGLAGAGDIGMTEENPASSAADGGEASVAAAGAGTGDTGGDLVSVGGSGSTQILRVPPAGEMVAAPAPKCVVEPRPSSSAGGSVDPNKPRSAGRKKRPCTMPNRMTMKKTKKKYLVTYGNGEKARMMNESTDEMAPSHTGTTVRTSAVCKRSLREPRWCSNPVTM